MKKITRFHEYLINKCLVSIKLLLILLCIPILGYSQWSLIDVPLNGEAAGDRSGSTITLSSDGNVLAIAAPFNDGNGTNSGQVRVYENDEGVWRQIGDDIDGALPQDFLGGYDNLNNLDTAPVSLNSDGSVIAVGAPHGFNSGIGAESGRVKIYTNTSGAWTQVGQDITGAAAGHLFGFSVDLNSEGNILAVGARQDPFNSSFGGYARVYELVSGVWTPLGALISAEALQDGFGASISINADGDVVAIGAPFNDGNGNTSGHVRVYQFASNVWTQVGIDIDGEAVGDFSGSSISINEQGNVIAVGAKQNDGTIFGSNSGHVRVYELISGIWMQIGTDIDGLTSGEQFGFSVELNANGNRLIVGAKSKSSNGSSSGQAIVYDNISGSWTQVFSEINGTATGNEFGYSVSISGDGFIIASGAPKNAANGGDSGQVRAFIDQTSLGIDNVSLNELSISLFPNPSNNYFEIETTETISSVEIYSLQGQSVKSFRPQNQYDISDLSNGIYFVKINANNKEITKRIIKD